MPASANSIESNELVTDMYMRMMQVSLGQKNDQILASMLASRIAGIGAMPIRLGLNRSSYETMMQRHFPGVSLPDSYVQDASDDDLAQRMQEQDELRELLLAHRVDPSEEGEWMADIVVYGCMGGDHLWQDLGLWSRKDLSLLMQQNFQRLAEKNNKDMKWKKFLYKQLCAAEGIYVCRSPSCEVCPDYAACFAPED